MGCLLKRLKSEEEFVVRNKMFKSLLVIIAGLTLQVGVACADILPLPLPNNDFPLINPGDMSADFDSMIDYIQKYNKNGVFIWTDDVNRTQFNIVWTALPNTVGTFFQGNLEFQDVQYSVLDNIKFEALYSTAANGAKVGDVVFPVSPNFISYSSYNIGGVDGISFDLSNWSMPSYIGFDLSIFVKGLNDGDAIFLGANKIAVSSFTSNGEPVSGDFTLAAPVPEPATMLLFGTGLIGLVGVARGRRKKE